MSNYDRDDRGGGGYRGDRGYDRRGYGGGGGGYRGGGGGYGNGRSSPRGYSGGGGGGYRGYVTKFVKIWGNRDFSDVILTDYVFLLILTTKIRPLSYFYLT